MYSESVFFRSICESLVTVRGEKSGEAKDAHKTENDRSELQRVVRV